MVKKKISVRLSAVGGKKVKAELKGIGEAGARGFNKTSRAIEIANARLARFTRRAKLVGRLLAIAAIASSVAMLRSSLRTIDEQAKLAASLDTTTASMQVLTRAGELAGVSMGEIQQATIQLTKRLSQAAAGGGPAADALDRLQLSAASLSGLTIDAKIAAIKDALEKFIPKAEQAAVASQIFGDRAGLIFTRIDSATLRQATQDVLDFGVAVSEGDAAQIQRTNDALSRMGLLWRGIANQLAVAAAPALEAIANWMASIGKVTGPLGRAIKGLFNNLGQIVTVAATFAAVMGGRLVLSLAAAVLGIRRASTALLVLKGALIRTGIGALIVGIGEAIYWFGKLVKGSGGFGKAMSLLADVAKEVWGRIGNSIGIFSALFTQMTVDIQIVFARALQWMKAKFFEWTNGIAPVMDEISRLFGGGDSGIWSSGAAERSAAEGDRILETLYRVSRSYSREMFLLFEANSGPLESIAALGQAIAESEESENSSADAVKKLIDALDDLPGSSGSAGSAAAEAGEIAQSAWESAKDALRNYADAAKNIGSQVGDVVTGAFSKAEDAIAKFVETGKFDFKSLVTSIIADLTRLQIKKNILGPLSEALDGLFSGGAGGGGGIFEGLFGGGGAAVPVNHSGGMVGGFAPTRMVSPGVFSGAQRMHNGGWVGLRPDEVPSILQKGERVLSRKEVASGMGSSAPISITIVAKDVESFRQSQAQIAADLSQIISEGQRGL